MHFVSLILCLHAEFDIGLGAVCRLPIRQLASRSQCYVSGNQHVVVKPSISSGRRCRINETIETTKRHYMAYRRVLGNLPFVVVLAQYRRQIMQRGVIGYSKRRVLGVYIDLYNN